jgi:multiple sugar transport system ATP-binding protein
LRADLRLELKRIQEDLGATVLYVTHDQIEAMTMANRIGIMENGRLVQLGSPREIYTDPCNIYVATRLGQPTINLLPEGLIGTGGAPAGTRTVGVRTEHVEIVRSANGSAQGRVDWIEHLGDQNHLHVTIGEHALVTLAEPTSDLKKNDAVEVRLTRPLFFDASGQRLR